MGKGYREKSITQSNDLNTDAEEIFEHIRITVSGKCVRFLRTKLIVLEVHLGSLRELKRYQL
jgi:hypothetical protein